MFRYVCLTFRQFLENLPKSLESVRISSENPQKKALECLYNKQNNTWLLVDMEFLFSTLYIVSHSFAVLTREIIKLNT